MENVKGVLPMNEQEGKKKTPPKAVGRRKRGMVPIRKSGTKRGTKRGTLVLKQLNKKRETPKRAPMPRHPRFDMPGASHHIIGQDIEKTKISRNEENRNDFINRLAALCQKKALAVYAWALIPNHYPPQR